MSYSVGYIKPGDFGRVCDVCGKYRPGSTFRRTGQWWICDFHPSFVPRDTLEKRGFISVGAPQSIPGAKPIALRDTFEAGEEEIFNFLTNEATIGTDSYSLIHASMPVTGTSGGAGVGAGSIGIYLYDLIVEGLRPYRWIQIARNRLKDCADWLMANMTAGPEIAGTTDDQWQWGGYLRSGFYFPGSDSPAAGVALLRAYQLFGSSRYLEGARACAWFMRTAQCGDLLVSNPSTSDAAATTPKHWGMWPASIGSTGTFFHQYVAGDLPGLEFLHLYQSIAGDEVIGSSTVTSVFGSSRAVKVSTAIQEVKDFWTTPQWSVDDGDYIQGLSTETPRDNFSSYSSAGGRGSWRFRESPTSTTVGTTVAGAFFTSGIKAFYTLDGATPFVTGLFDWLTSFESDSTYELPATTAGRLISGYDDRAIWASQRGTYDPKMAVAFMLTVRAGSPLSYVKRNGAPIYELHCTGSLAQLYSSRQPAAFKTFKEILSVPKPRTVESDGSIYIGILGRCGLSFQPWTSVASFPSPPVNRIASTTLAARVGAVYRQEPKAFMGRGVRQ